MKTKFAFIYQRSNNKNTFQTINASILKKAFGCKDVISLETRRFKRTKKVIAQNQHIGDREDWKEWIESEYGELHELNSFLNESYGNFYSSNMSGWCELKELYAFSGDAISTCAFFKFQNVDFNFFSLDANEVRDVLELSEHHCAHSKLTYELCDLQSYRDELLSSFNFNKKDMEFLQEGAKKIEKKLISRYNKMYESELNQLSALLTNKWN